MSGIPIEPYAKRNTFPIEVLNVDRWLLKLYGITLQNQPVDRTIVEAAKSYVSDVAGDWPRGAGHCYGFVTLHTGEEANWLLVDLWKADILHHFLYRSLIDQPRTHART
ncbi:MAG: hypothetical protein AAF456_09205, partial [Planctomycetota bacterium]